MAFVVIQELFPFRHHLSVIGPLHDLVTWYKVTHAGEQVAQWGFQNNASLISPPGPAFVLEGPLRNLLTSMCDFVPCDRIVQRAYSPRHVQTVQLYPPLNINLL